MNKQEKFLLSSFLIICMLASALTNISGQAPMPEILSKGTVTEQMKFIQERTKIFDNYRAIREDMFQKLMGNLSDTFKITFSTISSLESSVNSLKLTCDSLSATLESTKTSLNTAIDTKNSISLFGTEINKHAYNAITWIVIIVLLCLLFILLLTARRSIALSRRSDQLLQDMKDEFEAYRKSSREAREKMSMDHFNELRKLKGTNR